MPVRPTEDFPLSLRRRLGCSARTDGGEGDSASPANFGTAQFDCVSCTSWTLLHVVKEKQSVEGVCGWRSRGRSPQRALLAGQQERCAASLVEHIIHIQHISNQRAC